MKKKSKVNIGLFGIVVAITIFISTRDFGGNSTLNDNREEYDMAVKDTAAITKIVIESKEPGKVELTREGNKWMVNGKYIARPGAIQELLLTFHKVTLRHFPTENAEENILRRMASHGKDVKIYQGDDLVMNFIVGTDNLDQLGTYMMKKGASRPYAMHIPGFNGYLSSRFFTREDLWKYRVIFGTDNLDIRKLTMEYGIVPEESFSIEQNENGDLKVLDNNGLPIEPFNSQHARFYLGSIRTLQYEGAILEDEGAYAKIDSLRNTIPVFKLSVTDKTGETKDIEAFYAPAEPDTYDDAGQPMKYDPDSFYAIINGEQYVLIQTYAFGNILQTKEYFNR
ncbi:MAG: hypothetical protein EP346_00650 [Bacteroidetes bacterium]|uniref:DUF4340 domain-containing protein n=1 Tax=Phaeocystidibacter marisrubri TaxID=1577780 RepID=A0A6L3ZGN7_9FLAO|nr:hypothetical protein [Phaeocystidibacter marisrubri]KAB2816997.1 hypothetical protein F8C82_00975 [Phaeocystidibacter marisrubri]TNE31440.1 MAG: hypothetical protein EP346_00650 [Bacteroidota bacterium]GGH77279.1 hypothetical protein GCM10011318_26810 [Phaeocystidibacter marisrubri]